MKGKAIKTLCAIALTTGLFTVLPAGAEAFKAMQERYWILFISTKH